jgi:hypothetical protein
MEWVPSEHHEQFCVMCGTRTANNQCDLYLGAHLYALKGKCAPTSPELEFSVPRAMTVKYTIRETPEFFLCCLWMEAVSLPRLHTREFSAARNVKLSGPPLPPISKWLIDPNEFPADVRGSCIAPILSGINP